MDNKKISFGMYSVLYNNVNELIPNSELKALKIYIEENPTLTFVEKKEQRIGFNLNAEYVEERFFWFWCDSGTDEYADYVIDTKNEVIKKFTGEMENKALPTKRQFFVYDRVKNCVFLSHTNTWRSVTSHLNRLFNLAEPKFKPNRIGLNPCMSFKDFCEAFKEIEQIKIHFYQDRLNLQGLKDQIYDDFREILQTSTDVPLGSYIKSDIRTIKLKNLPTKNMKDFFVTIEENPYIEEMELKGTGSHQEVSILNRNGLTKKFDVFIKSPEKGKLADSEEVKKSLIEQIKERYN